jgi:hypothetical protein
MNDDLKTYHRELAMACLHRAPQPMTAAELAEFMGQVAMMEGHAPACFKSISASRVAGIMRTLQGDAQVLSQSKYDSSEGRDVPYWEMASRDKSYPFPFPPDEGEEPPEPAKSTSPYDHLSREQLIALLGIHDDIATAVARFKTELDELAANTRQRLAVAGVA